MMPIPTTETKRHLKDSRIFSWLCRSYLACKQFEEAARCADLARSSWLKIKWSVQHDN